jgi:hypothetical protein
MNDKRRSALARGFHQTIACGAAFLIFAAAALASDPPCEPRPDPLRFSLAVDPPQPQVGDEVRLIVGLSEVDGLLLGHASIAVLGAAPIFGDALLFHRQEGLLQGAVTFTVAAEVGGTAELTISVNYETECACPPHCFYRRTVESEPFLVTVAGPTATPTVACTPPICAGDEVFSCAETCPGGCGTTCATRTPTACPTPACASHEVFVCPSGTCPGACGLVCANPTQTPIPHASPTPTSNRPRPIAKGKAVPNPARSGETVELLDDGSIAISQAGRSWQYQGAPAVTLIGAESHPTFVAPSVAQLTVLTFQYTICVFNQCDVDEVEVSILPDACSGDCDSSGTVTIDELLAVVNMALGAGASATSCGAADTDGDGSIRIADTTAAVSRALNGC